MVYNGFNTDPVEVDLGVPQGPRVPFDLFWYNKKASTIAIIISQTAETHRDSLNCIYQLSFHCGDNMYILFDSSRQSPTASGDIWYILVFYFPNLQYFWNYYITGYLYNCFNCFRWFTIWPEYSLLFSLSSSSCKCSWLLTGKLKIWLRMCLYGFLQIYPIIELMSASLPHLLLVLELL